MSAPSVRPRLPALLGGAGLSALFFLPLVQALESNTALLFWQPRDTAAFAAAFALLALALAAAWYALERSVPRPRARLVGLALLAAIPLASGGVAVARQLAVPFDLGSSAVRAGLASLLLVLGALVLLGTARRPGTLLTIVRGLLLALSPASLIVLLLVAYLGLIGVRSPAGGGAASPARSHQQGDWPPASVYVLLFDELSYAALYPGGQFRSDLPALLRLSERSTTYRAAFTPDDRTLTSLAGLLEGRDLLDVTIRGDEVLATRPDGVRAPLDLGGPGSLFQEARARGLRTEMIGYYLPYCRLLGSAADACVSYSWYNYATLADRFSLLDPVRTTLILWPYQQHFGIAKIPMLSMLQHQIVERTTAAALAEIETHIPRFRFVHFSVPHHPYVFDAQGYHPPAAPMLKSAENYERQLRWVDAIVGKLVDRLVEAGEFETSALVVMSDHEYRFPSPGKPESMHVPLIVKWPGRRSRAEIWDSVKARDVLDALVSGRTRG